MKKVREFINECEQTLKSLKNSNEDKSCLIHMYGRLKELETKIKKFEESKEKQEFLNDIDSLIFIVSSMLDYYSEEMGER